MEEKCQACKINEGELDCRSCKKIICDQCYYDKTTEGKNEEGRKFLLCPLCEERF